MVKIHGLSSKISMRIKYLKFNICCLEFSSVDWWTYIECGELLSRLVSDDIVFFLNSQQDALIIQIYTVIKLYIFRASSLPIIRSFLLCIRPW